MSEPEDLILEGAYRATRVARDAWRRYGPVRRHAEVTLDEERPRLELFLAALFMRPIEIAPAQPAAPRNWLARLAQGSAVRKGARTEARLAPGTDGTRIFLPPILPVERCEEETRELYRLIAIEQSARLVRGTAAALRRLTGPAREWHSIREAATVDAWIASELPGLLPGLRRVRAAALAARGGAVADNGNPLERAIRETLRSEPASPPVAHSGESVPEGSRPVTPVWYWGEVVDAAPAAVSAVGTGNEIDPDLAASKPRVSEMRRRPRVRHADEDEDDRGAGTWVVRSDEPQESVEDPRGLQRPADRDGHADPDALGDALADLSEARVVRTPGQPREVLRSGDEIRLLRDDRATMPRRRGIVYPEWDYRAGAYRHPGACVRERPAALGNPAWASAALARHGRLVRSVRSRFERMQPRRVRLGRQTDGASVDIDAFVTAAADLQAGVSVDGRLYVAERHARRALAVSLLVDVSASTDAWVSIGQRIVDVEKDALLIVCEALEALGDRYAILTFSGRGSADVSVVPIKRFDERGRKAVHQRIAALDSERYTRMGAAIRHLTASLCAEEADRRLLLVLSDGKPNDEDAYEGAYGVEDTRQAVAEARRQGLIVFCLTVDRAAPRYAARVFGRSGFAVLRRAEQLPAVVVDVLRQLLRG